MGIQDYILNPFLFNKSIGKMYGWKFKESQRLDNLRLHNASAYDQTHPLWRSFDQRSPNRDTHHMSSSKDLHQAQASPRLAIALPPPVSSLEGAQLSPTHGSFWATTTPLTPIKKKHIYFNSKERSFSRVRMLPGNVISLGRKVLFLLATGRLALGVSTWWKLTAISCSGILNG